MANFLRSMFSEGDQVSSKRWISVTASLVLNFGSVWAIVKYPQFITDTLHSLMIFIAVMSGVATVAQIVSLVTRTPIKEDTPKP
jgi:hypothetical protein